ncbi:hypothetical protein QR78_17290 [Methylobacterium indicum]|uniref:DUF6538 domain-containing protein n=2 Tax=Methylobacterium indicum TaxID=1775910 RepID=A0ABR5H7P6_9HYPH|nr:hypothetical protein QR78_17290 [Methylobacterium indicum]KMO19864.1 hypothetical protein QR79_19095 [Methylobacterium indicum]
MPRYALVPFTRQAVKGGVFRFRLQLPDDVVVRLEALDVPSVKRTVTFSLKTRDPLAARSRALRAAADLGDLIREVRGGASFSAWIFDPSPYQRDTIVRPSAGPERVVAAQPAADDAERKTPARNAAMTLRRAYEEVYLPRRSERKGALPRRRSRLDIEKAISRFEVQIGDKAITAITRQDGERFARGLRVGSVATLKKALGAFATICNAAVAAGIIPSNPFRGLGPDRATVSAARRSYLRFDLDQLAQVFARTERESGAVLWLPRLLLLTGARLEEMV